MVTGKHGGIEHVLLDFPPKVLLKLAVGDKIQVKAFGVGLEILDCSEIKFFNLDPRLFKKMRARFNASGFLQVPVVAEVPAELMGSGLGAASVASGDYDITTADFETIKKFGLHHLRFGDIVAIMNTDNSYGRCFRKGAVTIGVVIHSDCVLAGHGPGVTTIMTSKKGQIKPVIDKKANIAYYLGIRN